MWKSRSADEADLGQSPVNLPVRHGVPEHPRNRVEPNGNNDEGSGRTHTEPSRLHAVSPKTVCIIGAGPAGLIAAKVLSHNHPKETFKVTVYDKADRVGGLWPAPRPSVSTANEEQRKNYDAKLHPDMRTNQSRYTVSFAALSWPETADLFPTTSQVGEYLQSFVDVHGLDVELSTEIITVAKEDRKWKVTVVNSGDSSQENRTIWYDHVIVASGHFGRPRIIESLETPYKGHSSRPVIHSSQLRSLQDLLTKNGMGPAGKGRKIVVVGGQMSGADAAALLALDLSSLKHSPLSASSDVISEPQVYEIVHVIQRPFWIMPRFYPKTPIAANQYASPMLPLDLVSYNRSSRPEIRNLSGHISEEDAHKTHTSLRNIAGCDQSDLGDDLKMSNNITEPPYLSITDNYSEFVRSGEIRVVTGKVTGLDCLDSMDPHTIKLEGPNGPFEILDVAAIVMATGFEPSSSIEYLDSQVLEQLQIDRCSSDLPLALNAFSTVNKHIQSLGFVGFYRSPYWGVMEMQARYLGKLWTGDSQAAAFLDADNSLDSIRELRTDPRKGQFPMGDYLYLMESFKNVIGMERLEYEDPSSDIVFPFQYRYKSNTSSEQGHNTALDETQLIANKSARDLIRASQGGKFVSRAVFRSMQGSWIVQRDLSSRTADYPSGTFSGVATFSPRWPTDDKFDGEYLYLEQGEYRQAQAANSQLALPAVITVRRQYVYRFKNSSDKLSVWFTHTAKGEDPLGVERPFHEITVLPPAEGVSFWRAEGHHWCEPDTYDLNYEFDFQGVYLKEWRVICKVNGPHKNYSLKSVYKRAVGKHASPPVAENSFDKAPLDLSVEPGRTEEASSESCTFRQT